MPSIYVGGGECFFNAKWSVTQKRMESTALKQQKNDNKNYWHSFVKQIVYFQGLNVFQTVFHCVELIQSKYYPVPIQFVLVFNYQM